MRKAAAADEVTHGAAPHEWQQADEPGPHRDALRARERGQPARWGQPHRRRPRPLAAHDRLHPPDEVHPRPGAPAAPRARDVLPRAATTKLVAEHRIAMEIEIVDVVQLTWADAHALVARTALSATLETAPDRHEAAHDGRAAAAARAHRAAARLAAREAAPEAPRAHRHRPHARPPRLRHVRRGAVVDLGADRRDDDRAARPARRRTPRPPSRRCQRADARPPDRGPPARHDRADVLLLAPRVRAPVAAAYSKRAARPRATDPATPPPSATAWAASTSRCARRSATPACRSARSSRCKPGDIVRLGIPADAPIGLHADDVRLHHVRARPQRPLSRRADRRPAGASRDHRAGPPARRRRDPEAVLDVLGALAPGEVHQRGTRVNREPRARPTRRLPAVVGRDRLRRRRRPAATSWSCRSAARPPAGGRDGRPTAPRGQRRPAHRAGAVGRRRGDEPDHVGGRDGHRRGARPEVEIAPPETQLVDTAQALDDAVLETGHATSADFRLFGAGVPLVQLVPTPSSCA